MIIIKTIQHKKAFVLTAAVVLTSLVLCIWAFAEGGAAEALAPVPAHTVFNYWQNSDGKRCNLTKETVTATAVYQAALPSVYTGEYLIIKGKHLGVTAYTGGKMLCSYDAVRGSTFFMIPVEELGDSSTVVLHLTPYRQKHGKITADVKLANKNDYLLTLLLQNKGTAAAVAVLAAALLSVLLTAGYKIKSKKYSGFSDGYLAVFLALLIIHLFFKSDLAAFTPCTPFSIGLLKTASLVMLPVPLISYCVAKQRLIRNLLARNKQP